MRVLVVDDHPKLRQMLATALRGRLVADVSEASRAAQAVERVSEQQFDVVVLDMNLADGSVLGALPLLRQLAGSARIVTMSAESTPTGVRKALEAGADAHVDKLAGLDGLCEAIRSTLTEPT